MQAAAPQQKGRRAVADPGPHTLVRASGSVEVGMGTAGGRAGLEGVVGLTQLLTHADIRTKGSPLLPG